MPRAILITAIAVVVVAATGIAYAANTYTVSATITPAKSGTPSKPTPVAGTLTFQVGDSQGLRPLPIKTYSIGLSAGIVPNNNVVPGCTLAQAQMVVVPAACNKAKIGTGSIQALAGPSTDRTQKLACFLTATLLNQTKKNHFSIRIDGSPAAAKPCVTSIHGAIDATFVKTGSASAASGGSASSAAAKLPVWAIKFTVPPGLLHAIPGFDAAVINNVSSVKKLTGKIKEHGKRVTHGYLESIGCQKTPSGKRTSQVVFTAEDGATNQATASGPCRK
jgi:hypothetical protein